MSTLQISLAAAGILILALIVAFNAWQHYKRTPRQPKSRTGSAASAVARFDPALDASETAAAQQSAHAALGAQPVPQQPNDLSGVLATTAADAPSSLPSAAAKPSRDALEPHTGAEAGVLNPAIDALATIEFAKPVTGETLVMVQPTTRRAGSKPFRIEAFNVDTQAWESPRAAQRYERLQAGVQLANRSGAVNEIEFSEFAAKVTQLADSLGATAELPDMLDVVHRARELDHFAAEHDVQLAFLLRAQQPTGWSPALVHQHAAAQGFVLGSTSARMVMPAPQHPQTAALTLSFSNQPEVGEVAAVHELLLSLDVPQLPAHEQPFALLYQVASQLCADLGAVLCDQDGTPMTAQSLHIITEQLMQLHERLEQRGLAAGSALARRLFS